MHSPLRGFAIALLILWVGLCIAAAVYSQQKDIPWWVTAAVVPAFLVEGGLYLASGLAATRSQLERSISPRGIALIMTISAAVPYCVYSAGTGVFRMQSLAALLALAAVAAFWYVVIPRHGLADFLFLVLLAAVVLLKLFPRIYLRPTPAVDVSILGMAMWIRIGLIAILSIRRMDGIGFGFVPRRSDWLIGLRHYFYFLPIGLILATTLGVARTGETELSRQTAALSVLSFFAVLWVLALSEEFFFRGLVQQLLRKQFGSEFLAILIGAIVFGLAHLPFRGFPNWRFALLAAVAGLFYGRAFSQAGSVRASMVTHALVVTTWQVFLL